MATAVAMVLSNEDPEGQGWTPGPHPHPCHWENRHPISTDVGRSPKLGIPPTPHCERDHGVKDGRDTGRRSPSTSESRPLCVPVHLCSAQATPHCIICLLGCLPPTLQAARGGESLTHPLPSPGPSTGPGTGTTELCYIKKKKKKKARSGSMGFQGSRARQGTYEVPGIQQTFGSESQLCCVPVGGSLGLSGPWLLRLHCLKDLGI